MDDYDISDNISGSDTSSDNFFNTFMDNYDFSEENVFLDDGFLENYSDADGAVTPNADGSYTYKTWTALDEIAGVPAGTTYDGAVSGVNIGAILKKYGGDALNALTKTFTKPASQGGGVDWRTIATIGGGVAGLMGIGKAEQRPTGYKGEIPKYTALRERVEGTYDPERRPGSSGQRYFSDVAFAKPEGIEAARAATQEQATGLGALNVANPAMQKRPAAMAEPEALEETETATRPASAVIEDKPVPTYATGGIAGLKKGDYLRGNTDGMADKLRTTIENKQPAALSHGEFVVPADVVSHLGNGNSEAGAKKLYEMMNRIRQARTGTTKQGKQINPEKYTPA